MLPNTLFSSNKGTACCPYCKIPGTLPSIGALLCSRLRQTAYVPATRKSIPLRMLVLFIPWNSATSLARVLLSLSAKVSIPHKSTSLDDPFLCAGPNTDFSILFQPVRSSRHPSQANLPRRSTHPDADFRTLFQPQVLPSPVRSTTSIENGKPNDGRACGPRALPPKRAAAHTPEA